MQGCSFRETLLGMGRERAGVMAFPESQYLGGQSVCELHLYIHSKPEPSEHPVIHCCIHGGSSYLSGGQFLTGCTLLLGWVHAPDLG